MQYWLMKSEPETYGIDALEAMPNKIDHWDGIRNYQARNMMRDDMQVGDQAFFYHSNCKEPAIVGLMQIHRLAYPDFTALDSNSAYYDPKATQENNKWVMVDVQHLKTYSSPLTLRAMRNNPKLSSLKILQKGSRLSITPVSQAHFEVICDLVI